MSTEYSTENASQGSGNAFKADEGHPRRVNRVCAYCGAPLMGRRPQTRFCCPTCRALAYDLRHNRTSHAAQGGQE